MANQQLIRKRVIMKKKRDEDDKRKKKGKEGMLSIGATIGIALGVLAIVLLGTILFKRHNINKGKSERICAPPDWSGSLVPDLNHDSSSLHKNSWFGYPHD